MLKKLFNKKMIAVYIVALCLTLIAGSVSVGFAVNYSGKFMTEVEAIADADQKEAGLDDTSEMVLNLITKALEAYSGTESESSGGTTVELSDTAKAYRSAKNISIAAAVIMYVLSVLSIAGIITCVQYEKYLNSEKYKAKLKRMKRYEHSYNTGM